jgi:proline iminopeptidase
MRLKMIAFLLLALFSVPIIAAKADPVAEGEHEVELRGVKIWYLVRGNGPILLIQPGGAGWGGDSTIYVEALQSLESSHTVVYYDPRGIGRSGRSADPALYTLDEYVEDLEALRRHLGLETFNLAGHSHGGSVALKYALAYPKRLERLLVLDSGPFVREHSEWMESRPGYEAAQALWAARDTTLGPDEEHAEFVRIFLPVFHFHDYESVRHTVEDLLARTTFSAEPFQQAEGELYSYDISDQIAAIRTPTMIVIGDHDPPDIREGAYLMHDRIPGAQLVVAPECGHWPFLECPDLFFPAVSRFLAEER